MNTENLLFQLILGNFCTQRAALSPGCNEKEKKKEDDER